MHLSENIIAQIMDSWARLNEDLEQLKISKHSKVNVGSIDDMISVNKKLIDAIDTGSCHRLTEYQRQVDKFLSSLYDAISHPLCAGYMSKETSKIYQRYRLVTIATGDLLVPNKAIPLDKLFDHYNDARQRSDELATSIANNLQDNFKFFEGVPDGAPVESIYKFDFDSECDVVVCWSETTPYSKCAFPIDFMVNPDTMELHSWYRSKKKRYEDSLVNENQHKIDELTLEIRRLEKERSKLCQG